MYERPTKPREPDLAEQREAIEELRDDAMHRCSQAVDDLQQVWNMDVSASARAEIDKAIEALDNAHDAVERACDIAAGILKESA